MTAWLWTLARRDAEARRVGQHVGRAPKQGARRGELDEVHKTARTMPCPRRLRGQRPGCPCAPTRCEVSTSRETCDRCAARSGSLSGRPVRRRQLNREGRGHRRAPRGAAPRHQASGGGSRSLGREAKRGRGAEPTRVRGHAPRRWRRGALTSALGQKARPCPPRRPRRSAQFHVERGRWADRVAVPSGPPHGRSMHDKQAARARAAHRTARRSGPQSESPVSRAKTGLDSRRAFVRRCRSCRRGCRC